MSDIGTPPPPPPDVAAQMRPSPEPAPDPMMMGLGGLLGQGAPMPSPDMVMKVMAVTPLITQLTMQAPVLAPAADNLMAEMKSRMAAPSMGLAALAGPMLGGGPQALPVGGPPAPPSSPAAPADTMLPAPSTGPAATGGPIAMPPPPPPMGLMDIAMQLEMQLPSIGASDATLLPAIQFFIAKMRDEVPRIVNADPKTQADAMSDSNPAPTDGMLKQLPVVA